MMPMPEEKHPDPILTELHSVRRQMLEEAGGSLEGLVEVIRRHEEESGREFIKLPVEGQSISAKVSS